MNLLTCFFLNKQKIVCLKYGCTNKDTNCRTFDSKLKRVDDFVNNMAAYGYSLYPFLTSELSK